MQYYAYFLPFFAVSFNKQIIKYKTKDHIIKSILNNVSFNFNLLKWSFLGDLGSYFSNCTCIINCMYNHQWTNTAIYCYDKSKYFYYLYSLYINFFAFDYFLNNAENSCIYHMHILLQGISVNWKISGYYFFYTKINVSKR